MKTIKLLTILTAFVIFVIACGPSATTPNTSNSNADNKPAANTAPANAVETNTQVGNANTGNTATPANTANTAANKANANANTAANKANVNTAAPAVDVAAGRQLYSAQCAKCHQQSGKGGKVTIDGKEIEPDDLTGSKAKARPDAKLTKDIVQGFPEDGMPAFRGKLNDAQIKNIIGFIRSIQH